MLVLILLLFTLFVQAHCDDYQFIRFSSVHSLIFYNNERTVKTIQPAMQKLYCNGMPHGNCTKIINSVQCINVGYGDSLMPNWRCEVLVQQSPIAYNLLMGNVEIYCVKSSEGKDVIWQNSCYAKINVIHMFRMIVH